MSIRPDGAEELRPQTKLDSCPFCGGSRLVVVKAARFDNPAPDEPDAYAYNVHCTSCACDGPWTKSQSGAERNWNMRPGTACPGCGDCESYGPRVHQFGER